MTTSRMASLGIAGVTLLIVGGFAIDRLLLPRPIVDYVIACQITFSGHILSYAEVDAKEAFLGPVHGEAVSLEVAIDKVDKISAAACNLGDKFRVTLLASHPLVKGGLQKLLDGAHRFRATYLPLPPMHEANSSISRRGDFKRIVGRRLSTRVLRPGQ